MNKTIEQLARKNLELIQFQIFQMRLRGIAKRFQTVIYRRAIELRETKGRAMLQQAKIAHESVDVSYPWESIVKMEKRNGR